MMDIDLAFLSQSDSEIVKETKEKKKRRNTSSNGLGPVHAER